MDWIVSVSAQERAGAALHQATAANALTALRRNGCLLLRNALDKSTVAAMRAEFDAQCGALDAAQMAARALGPPPNAVLNVGDGRYEIAPRIKGAFARPDVLANPLLCGFLVSVLSNTMRLGSLTAVVSYPGADQQHIHRDHGHLYADPRIAPVLPPYAINIAVPLIDVDRETGPTGIWPGSHLRAEGTPPPGQQPAVVSFQRGDCLLLDYRTLHAGMPNRSATVRPIVYLVYTRTWFFDEVNHATRPPLDMTVEEYEALPEHVRPILMRVIGEAMRARHLNRERDA